MAEDETEGAPKLPPDARLDSLDERLERLQASGIVEQVPTSEGAKRQGYRLTEKGAAFYGELEQTWQELSNAVNTLTKETQPNPDNFNQTV